MSEKLAGLGRFEKFIPIEKFDEATGEAWGYIAEEVGDRSGEIFDYAKGKPKIVAWSDSQKAASFGKSLGNVRGMHKTDVAGHLEHVEYLDEEKRVHVGAKITDAEHLKKLRAGDYTGFSIGGSYAEKWKDGELTRYVPEIQEVSLVDRPCMVGATFTLVKADGQTEQVPLVGRVTKQVWTCAVPAHEHEAKADAVKCDGAEGGPGLTVKVDATEAMKLVKAALAEATSPEALKKCLYQIAQLAGSLQSIQWVHDAEEMEAAAEGDASAVPDKIKAGITALFEALSTMVDEEAAEWNAEEGAEGMAMAVSTTLEKINSKPERLRELLAKRAEEDGEMKPEELQKIVGDENAKLQKSMTDGLAKVETRIGEVEKGFTEKLAAVTTEIETIKKAVPAPTSVKQHAVTKEKDAADEKETKEKAEKGMTPHELMKRALSPENAIFLG